MDEEYIQYLIQLGFDRETAEKIEEGQRVDALTEKEFLHFAAAWENDKVEPMKPLVEKYGWERLVERLAASTNKEVHRLDTKINSRDRDVESFNG